MPELAGRHEAVTAGPAPGRTADRDARRLVATPVPWARLVPLWGAWHLLACALLGGAAVLALGEPRPSPALAQAGLLVAGYLALSLYVVPAAARSLGAALGHLAGAALLGFGGGFLLLDRAGLPASPWLVGVGGLAAALLALLPYLGGRARLATLAALLAAGAAAAAAGTGWTRTGDAAAEDRVRGTALYSLAVRTYADLIPSPAEDGGALDPAGEGMILAAGDGTFHWIARDAEGGRLAARALPIPAPMDRAAYLADFEDPEAAPRLRLTDVVFGPQDDRLYVAHQAWDAAGRCYALRVSTLAIGWAADGAPAAAGEWGTLFESRPCVAAEGTFDDSETGGMLAWGADGGLLLTLGDLGFAGLDGAAPFAQREDADYGKVLRIDPASGAATTLSVGHRNPQGLTVARDGRVWEAEHGPQGGDEVNLIAEGANYGWPAVTYGTEYGSSTWPLDPEGRDHGAFREPALAFVPSVATSALVEVAGDEFPLWDGDLLLGSLRAETLYRIRLRDDRVTYVEPIPLGRRVRDLAQAPDGRIVVWTDSGVLTELSRAERAGGAFARLCAGCHAPAFGEPAGPSLAGVVGRDVASLPGFDYSPALLALDGAWTEAALDAFLRDPDAYAPGTTMYLSELAEADRAEVVATLAAEGG